MRSKPGVGLGCSRSIVTGSFEGIDTSLNALGCGAVCYPPGKSGG